MAFLGRGDHLYYSRYFRLVERILGIGNFGSNGLCLFVRNIYLLYGIMRGVAAFCVSLAVHYDGFCP